MAPRQADWHFNEVPLIRATGWGPERDSQPKTCYSRQLTSNCCVLQGPLVLATAEKMSKEHEYVRDADHVITGRDTWMV